MAKQTFTTGQVLTAAQMTSLQQTAMGGGSATAKTASYTLVAADAGATVIMNSASATTITVNTSLFSAGDTVFIQNLGAGVSTITPGTATVNTASSLALAQYESGNLYFTAAGASIFSKADGAAASGGGMTSLASGSLPAATSLTLSSISADYQDLRLVIRNAQHGNAGGTGMGYRLNGQGDGGEYNPRLNINSEYGVGAGSDSTRIPLTNNDAKKEENICIQINIFDYANTSSNKRWQHAISYMKQGTTTWETNFQVGTYKFNNSAINQIQLFIDNAFTAGTYQLFGIK